MVAVIPPPGSRIRAARSVSEASNAEECAMGDRQKHDLAYAISFRIFELLGDQIPADLRRDTLEEFYAISKDEIDTHDRLAARQEARLKPIGRSKEGG